MPGDPLPRQLTVEEKICVHLLGHHHRSHEYVLPQDISQTGIAESVGVQRGHASVALISLKKKDLVEERISRVHESNRRKKVYFLTEAGLEEAVKIKKMIEGIVHEGVHDGSVIQIADSLEFSATSDVTQPPSLTPASISPTPASASSSSLSSSASSTPPSIPIPSSLDPATLTYPPPPRFTPAAALPPPFSQKKGRLSGKQYLIIIGLIISIITIALLWKGTEGNNEPSLALSYLTLILTFISLNSCSFDHSNERGELEITLHDAILIVYSLMILGIVLQSTVESEFYRDEILQCIVVFIPLLILLNVQGIIPENQDIRVAGISGTLIMLYGIGQTVFPIYSNELHYPMVWVLGGFLIFIQGHFKEQGQEKRETTELVRGRKEEPIADGKGEGNREPDEKVGHLVNTRITSQKLSDPRLMTSACIGAGIFIMISIVANLGEVSFETLPVLLLVLWFALGLLLVYLSVLDGSEDIITPLLLSSLLVLTGCLFFFTAGLFITMEKYIEALMEILVGAIIIRFSLHYLVINRTNLIFASLSVLVGLLSVYSLYIDL